MKVDSEGDLLEETVRFVTFEVRVNEDARRNGKQPNGGDLRPSNCEKSTSLDL